ncbi:transcriptional regulator with XRE-family HTH domain [Rhizobium skierniewicense]|uniref:Transcriptional regulator with XRE-family HTH domain n=1 Tax=Rhizobium skierniewicense TaxID=984260 RepID=A0A7W6CGC4_9HYPH|nr:XRE family transcriptional regulator [Rhizobium skierniewicense]MBB3946666.1 transcriptional regulator with XRE-family HTH domain [Rhizobium skierniewicense]
MENDNFERSLADRIRQLRLKANLTLDQLANASGVSRAMISRIERGEASPTAALLARICAAFGLSLSGFFAKNEDAVSPLIKRQDQPIWQDPDTGYTRRAISPPRVGSDVDIVEVNFPARAQVSFPPHAASHGMTQYVWLLEGTLEMTTGDGVHRMSQGDCLFMPVGEGHTFHNPSDTPARYAVVLDQRKR